MNEEQATKTILPGQIIGVREVFDPEGFHPCHNCDWLRWDYLTLDGSAVIKCPFCIFANSLAISKCPHYKE